MTTKIADDSASIAQRLKEIEAEKMAAIMGKPLEPTEAPADIDWTGMYGYGPSVAFHGLAGIQYEWQVDPVGKNGPAD